MPIILLALQILFLCYPTFACDIAIDAGHGGHDLGTRYLQLQEKDLTLKFAYLLHKELITLGHKNTYLTRNTDQFIDINHRTAMLNQWQCRIFISLHINSSLNETTSGMELYTYKTKNSEIKNSLDDNDFQLIWKSLLFNDLNKISHQAAQFFSFELKKHYPDLSIKSGRQSFRILNHISQPAILLELGYISNDQDRNRLTHLAFQTEWSKVMAKIIHHYLRSTPYSTHF